MPKTYSVTTPWIPLVIGLMAVGLLGSPAFGSMVDDPSSTDTDTQNSIQSPKDEERLHSSSSIPNQRELTPEAQKRQAKIARCLAIYHTRQVNADFLRPWSIMHGLIGFGQDTLITSRGKTLNAVEYLCDNGMGGDRRILEIVDDKL